MSMQVNITSRVDGKTIRREVYNGREHVVIPSYTLPSDVVMNGEFYPAKEIDAHYAGLEGTLAPLGHPTVNGKYVSAFTPEGINIGHIGAWNRNVRKEGNRIYAEKWVDIEVAKNSEGGRRLLSRVEAIERREDVKPIHTSVAVFRERTPATGEIKARGADWVVKITAMDHDAILLDEVGAATPDQGVGLMVNADLAKPLDDPSFIAAVAEKIKSFFNQQGSPATNEKGGEMPLSQEEKAEIVNDIVKGLSANTDGAIKQLSEKIDALQANQKSLTETLTANSKAEEKVKREAVAAKHGEVVANALSGDALDVMYKNLGESKNLGANSATSKNDGGAPNPLSYFGGE